MDNLSLPCDANYAAPWYTTREIRVTGEFPFELGWSAEKSCKIKRKRNIEPEQIGE